MQNATALDLIADKNHVYEIKFRIKNRSPQCAFEKVGCNQASTFTGFCSHHDTEIFKPIDTKPLSLEDPEQLFLIAYRSVTRELHVVLEGAMRIQGELERQIAVGAVSKDQSSPVMVEATKHLLKSWGTWKHRYQFYDAPFTSKKFNEILHTTFWIDRRKPVLASSSFFSVDDKAWGKKFSGITLNIVPTSITRSAVIISYPRSQSGKARRYIAPIILKSGEERLQALSLMLIDRAENFFVSPSHLESWSIDKRKAIESAFISTIGTAKSLKPSPTLMLF